MKSLLMSLIHVSISLPLASTTIAFEFISNTSPFNSFMPFFLIVDCCAFSASSACLPTVINIFKRGDTPLKANTKLIAQLNYILLHFESGIHVSVVPLLNLQ